jgi:hypothetical protein
VGAGGRTAASLLILALALCACGVPAPASNPASGGPTGSEGPATVLGAFDRATLQQTFDTVLSEEDLTETKRRYTADYHLPLGLEFTIDPADPAMLLLETTLRLSVNRSPGERKVEDDWFRVFSAHQPEALDWIRRQRDDYLKKPGPDTSIRSMFGPVCAGFFAFGADTSASGKATTMGYFVETQDAHVNCQGNVSGS